MGKRLIARAVAQMPEVRDALTEGTVVIGRGITNTYVAEEILETEIGKGEYVAGRTLPPGIPWDKLGGNSFADIVIKDGELVAGVTTIEAAKSMKKGDVYLKGGNALNYARQQVGVLVGHPEGGTIGGVYGTLISRKVHLIIPIGLEKLVSDDIEALSRLSRDVDTHPQHPVLSLFPITGTIVTEIEALRILCDVHAHLLSAGGVAGAEGAIWLLLEGEKEELDNAIALCDALKDEPPVLLTGDE